MSTRPFITPHIDPQALATLYRSGHGLHVCAACYRTTLKRIRQILVQAKVPILSVGRPKGISKANQARLSSIQTARAQGLSFKAIASQYGISRQAIQQFLKAHSQ